MCVCVCVCACACVRACVCVRVCNGQENDWFRLRRIFEVHYTTGQPLSSYHRPQVRPPPLQLRLHRSAAEALQLRLCS